MENRASATDALAPAASGHRYAFICGLHRSGTTLITRSLAEHPMVSGFSNTGVIEDEGQFLQTVLPLENAFGGVGQFGFDARAHMTETSTVNTPENGGRLRSEWHRHWDLARPVLVEKTPSNLLRMRLMQALCPPAYFVVVTRHPVAASLAAMKWTEGNIFSLLCHWAHCYRIARADTAQVERVLWVSYEAFVADPVGQLDRIATFLELSPFGGWRRDLRNENGRYFNEWRERFHGDGDRSIAQKPPARRRSIATRVRERLDLIQRERALPPYRRMDNLRNFHDALDAAAWLEPAVAEFGYSFADLERYPVP